MGRMQSFSLLKEMAHMFTTVVIVVIAVLVLSSAQLDMYMTSCPNAPSRFAVTLPRLRHREITEQPSHQEFCLLGYNAV
jgi:hypothetical protein